MKPNMADTPFSFSSFRHFAAITVMSAALIGCGGLNVEADYPTQSEAATEDSGSFLDFFSFGGAGQDDAATANAEPDADSEAPGPATTPPAGLGVNADLWRAALDTISFMPLAAADPLGGTLITDWYNDPGQKNERVKLNVVISGLELRADAVRVSLFREKRSGGRWTGIGVSNTAARQLENIILTKARDYRIARGTR